jgi:hypothetical protein
VENEPRLPPLTAVIVAAAIGLMLLVAAWSGASNRRESADQMAWLNLGVAGVVLTGAVAGSWVLRSRRAVEVRLGRILSGVHEVEPEVPAPVAAERLVTALRMTRYHIPGCLLVNGKTLSAETRATHEHAGLRPCEMCRP